MSAQIDEGSSIEVRRLKITTSKRVRTLRSSAVNFAHPDDSNTHLVVEFLAE